MIFNAADRNAIFRSQVRKACESSAMIAHREIPAEMRAMIQSHLVKEVCRCGHMLRIADNDLSHIRRAAVELDMEPVNLPLNIYGRYLETMDEHTRENEAHYMFLYSYMLGYMDHIRNGIKVADGIESGGNPISYSEIINLSRVRGVYEKCAERCRGLLDEEDVPYLDAYEYADCALEEISIIIRVATGKNVDLDEISEHLERSEEADPEPFRDIFMTDMDPEDLALVEDFENGWESRVDIMVG